MIHCSAANDHCSIERVLTMQIHLQYGQDGLTAELPTENATIIRPRFVAGLPDEQAAFREAVRRPNGARPLAEAVSAHERVAIVIADGTRPLPSARLLPWILAELAHVPEGNISYHRRYGNASRQYGGRA